MKRRILLADDSVTIQKVIELTFMDEDYEVRAVSNGDEAVTLLSSINPDFVIADVHMPGANGYEVCRRAKRIRPDLPVLLLVGTFEPFDEAQARAVGADSHLKKPFDSQELLQRVEELLASKAPAAHAATTTAAPEAPAPQAVPDWLAASAAPDFAAAPDLSAEPSWGQPAEPAWGNFELEPEPASPFAAPTAAAAPAAQEPFDHEPSFSLEPDPGFQVEAEPVFSLDADEPSFGVREDVFGAPSELSFDETPQDRYIAEDNVAEEPAAAAAGFNWTPEPEPFHFEPPAAPAWAPAVPEPLVEPQLQWSEPEPFAALEAEPFAAAPEPEPAFPPGPTLQSAYPPGPTEPAFPPGPTLAADASHEVLHEASGNGNGRLSDDDVDRIARRVVEMLGDRAVRDVAWEVIPDMAEVIIRDRLRELEAQVE
jgi:CheY-like chemotaxis protein